MPKAQKRKRPTSPKRAVKQGNPGTGAFERCVKKVGAKGKARDPRAVCATAGRKKYGKRKFQEMALKGKKAAARRRGNPVEAAAETYEKFHGRAPGQVFEVTERIHEHSVLSGIGKLVSLLVLSVDGKHEVLLSNFGGALLAQNEKGTQLFIKGGKQGVNLKDFGIDKPHESEVLGAALEVVYDTQKDHLRPEDGGKAHYHHKFGKGGLSRLPIVVYDVPNQLLHLAGGGYTLPEVGIRG